MEDVDAIRQQEFQIDESWSERSEKQRQNFFNQALRDRELDLINARQELQMLRSVNDDSNAVVGSLLALAFQLNEAAAQKARMHDEEVPESVEKLREVFLDAMTLEYEFREDEVLTPDQIQRLSERVSKLGRPPAKLERLMRQNGTKIRSLIGLTYAGTEVMTEGSSEENTPSVENEEG